MKRFALALLALVVVGVAVVLLRAAALPSLQQEVAPAPPLEVEGDAVAQRLALAIRLQTLSNKDRAEIDASAFRQLHGLLRAVYPAAHRVLERETVGDLSLLYTWRGSKPELAPVLLAAHLDVVPVDPTSFDAWTQPPFEGVVEDGVVWGRGALDDKGNLLCVMEAVEGLVLAGFEPERTVYLAFGHDEEVGGDDGAVEIARLLESRGVELEWVLDEGGVIAEGFVPGLVAPVAVIGIAEKGHVSITLDIEAPGGHSSTPPRHTAIGDLAAAVVALENHPMPGRIDGQVADFLDYLAPELPFWPRLVLANRWLFGPLLEWGFGKLPPLDAMLRTTTAVTIFEAGVKENVLPVGARALANFRIHPRDSIDAVRRHVREVVDDPRIRLQAGLDSIPREPSRVSAVDSDAFRLLQRSIGAVFEGVPAVPFLVLGGTDSRHYEAVSRNVYRFSPFVLGEDTLRLLHGTDERISIENLVGGIRFFSYLLREGAGTAQSPSS